MRIFVFITFLFFALSCKESRKCNNYNFLDYKGKVIQITQTTYSAVLKPELEPSEKNKFVKGEILNQDSTKYIYNDEGYLIMEITLYDTTIYKYDNSNFLISQHDKKKSDIFSREYIKNYEYANCDEINGVLSSKSFSEEKFEDFGLIKIKLHPNGKKYYEYWSRQRGFFESDPLFTNRTDFRFWIYEYDKKGNIEMITEKDPDQGDIITDIRRFSNYKFDDFGNWISVIVYSSMTGREIIERNIKYSN